jgi:hypothetical protein
LRTLSDHHLVRLLLHAFVDLGESIKSHERWWIGVRHVERPYSRVPGAGESVRLGDDPDSLPWPVDHVAWNNSSMPGLTLRLDEADPMFDDIGAVRMLEGYGFRKLLKEAAPTEKALTG